MLCIGPRYTAEKRIANLEFGIWDLPTLIGNSRNSVCMLCSSEYVELQLWICTSCGFYLATPSGTGKTEEVGADVSSYRGFGEGSRYNR